MEKVNPKMDPKWSEVITCDTHAEGTAVQMRDGMDTNLESGMMTYQNCSLREGKTVAELMQANMQMNKFMDKAGVDSISAGIIFPGVGAPNGFDYTMTFWSPGMKKLGETFEKASKKLHNLHDFVLAVHFSMHHTIFARVVLRQCTQPVCLCALHQAIGTCEVASRSVFALRRGDEQSASTEWGRGAAGS